MTYVSFGMSSYDSKKFWAEWLVIGLSNHTHRSTPIGNDLLDVIEQFLLDILVKSQKSESEWEGVCSCL